jgi:hypothetical protein
MKPVIWAGHRARPFLAETNPSGSLNPGSFAWSWVMRESPSMIPGIDRNVYLVLDDFGRMGCAWHETKVEDTEIKAVIDDLLEDQYISPVRVIGFNLSEGWVRDVSKEIARKLRQRCADEGRELPYSLHQLVEQAART